MMADKEEFRMKRLVSEKEKLYIRSEIRANSERVICRK